MTFSLAIRREDLAGERRAPICPEQILPLVEKKIAVEVQSSAVRIFSDAEYAAVGAKIVETLDSSPIILGVKEIPCEKLLPQKTYLFFSHTIKGQSQNMPLLRKLVEYGCTLLDYERITDDHNRRLVFFSYYAGVAGTLDAIWALGQRLLNAGLKTPLANVKRARDYESVAAAKKSLAQIGAELRDAVLPPELSPIVVGITGKGNVSRGAREVISILGANWIRPGSIFKPLALKRGLVAVVFGEKEMVAPIHGQPFNLMEYYQNPQHYRGDFARFLPHLNVLMNCIYWEEKYPRLVTLEDLKHLYEQQAVRLQIIGDISCDINGSIQATVKASSTVQPAYVFDPQTQIAHDGFEGRGPVIMAIANLPTQLPIDASLAFGRQLAPFLTNLAQTDFSKPFNDCELMPPLRRATVLYRGQFTRNYRYMEKFL